MAVVMIVVHRKGAGVGEGQFLGNWDQTNHCFYTRRPDLLCVLPDDLVLMSAPGGVISLGMLRKSLRSQNVRIKPEPIPFGNREFTADTPEEVAKQRLIDLQEMYYVFGYTYSSIVWKGTTPESNRGATFKTAGTIRIVFEVASPNALGGPVDWYQCVVRLEPVDDYSWEAVECEVVGGSKRKRFIHDDCGWGETN